MEHVLLSRDAFREGVFARDNHRCVLCGDAATDAHHILERRLWPDRGYYLANGASVCADDHIRCETTQVSVEAVREAAGIRTVLVPPHLYADQCYDKWGNPVLEDGRRLRGELFYDESVQKILGQGGFLERFTHQVKYPRTFHLPWSPGMNDDDRMLPSASIFEGRRVIVTEKMDGENTSMYRDYIHARSVDGRSHLSRDWVKGFWARICGDIPEGWRVCGENLYAEHSIGYQALPSYFMGFSIWNDRNECLAWDATLEWFALLDIIHVPVLFDGLYEEREIRRIWSDKDWGAREGYVMRVADGFSYRDFRSSIAKFVRRGHVQTTKHWMHGQPVRRNGLAQDATPRARARP
jgi:hypothetical protein